MNALYVPDVKGFPWVLLLVLPCSMVLDELLPALEVLLWGGTGTQLLGGAETAGSIFFGSELFPSTERKKKQ